MKGLEFEDAFKESKTLNSASSSILSRFAIDYSVYNKVNIPPQLEEYPGFINSEKRRRISFLLPSTKVFSEFLNLNLKKKLYTTDPKVKEFRRIFLTANSKIDDLSLNYFVFYDKENKDSTPGILNNIMNNVNEGVENAFDKAMPYILVLGIAYIYFNRKSK